MFSLASSTLAQVEPPPNIVSADYTPVRNSKSYVRVVFSRKVLAAGVAATFSGGAATVDHVETQDLAAESETLAVVINGKLEESDKPQICFSAISYNAGGTARTAAPGCANITFKTAVEAGKERDALLAEIKKTQKTTNEKNIFASGFLTTASQGTQGGADIILNSIDLGVPGLNNFLQLRKATQEGADHKNFEAGARYRYIHSFNQGLLEQIKRTPQGLTTDKLIRQMQEHWVSALMFDVAAKLEGQATKFDVSNFVGDTTLQFRSMSRGFAVRHGYGRGFIMPIGFEGGQSLRTGDASLQNSGTASGDALKAVDWIARYKAGAGTVLFYEDWNSQLPIRRVDLEINVVFRDLFFAEALYNKDTKKVDRTGKGVRAYGQAEIRLYVGQSSAGRFGMRLSYNRGSVPPVYARVKSFQFGFLFESAEDSRSK